MKDWRLDAACRDRVIYPSDDLWYSDDPLDREEAVSICRSCPVVATCLDQALEDEKKFPGGRHGVWGGLTADARQTLVEGIRRTRRAVAVCGTEGGYARHRRLGEDTCSDCRSAHAAATRERASA